MSDMATALAGPAATTREGRATDARIVRIVGALAEAAPLGGAALYELVRVGENGLLGEVIRLDGDRATIQVFEETTGLRLGESVGRTGRPLAVELGPGLLGSVLDGVGRPLDRLAEIGGDFIRGGLTAATLATDREWEVDVVRVAGGHVSGGDILGTLRASAGPARHVLVPPGVSGRIDAIDGGSLRIGDRLARLEDGTELSLSHAWPVRRARPVATRLAGDRPFLTGQRVFDFLFPVAEGGTVAVPGGFGTPTSASRLSRTCDHERTPPAGRCPPAGRTTRATT